VASPRLLTLPAIWVFFAWHTEIFFSHTWPPFLYVPRPASEGLNPSLIQTSFAPFPFFYFDGCDAFRKRVTVPPESWPALKDSLGRFSLRFFGFLQSSLLEFGFSLHRCVPFDLSQVAPSSEQ